MSFKPIDPTAVDLANLNKELDRTKSKIFIGKNSVFLGTLLSSMEFIWTKDIPTAATDGITIWWNPDWFLSLVPEARKTVLLHELWHPGSLHFIRKVNRDPRVWNMACDARINRDLSDEGNSFKGIEDCFMDEPRSKRAEEDIYDDMAQNPQKQPEGFEEDLIGDPGDAIKSTIVGNVIRAVQQAKEAGQAGDLPGHIEQHLSDFLAPVIPWQSQLQEFFSEMLDEDYTWSRPNKRYQDIYLPSKFTDDGRLEHLIYYLDVSGSVSDHDVLRFNSEVKYIKDTFNPEKLTLVQFDTQITKEDVFTSDDPFEAITIIGRGGTSLDPVRKHIIDSKPTAAIIFSDLYCYPMKKLPFDIPVIWVVVSNKQAQIPFGRSIHIS